MSRTEPQPVLCPQCGKPAVREEQGAVTDMYFAPFFDEQGRRHLHDGNSGGIWFVCANEHSWSPPRTCWCGWTSHD